MHESENINETIDYCRAQLKVRADELRELEQQARALRSDATLRYPLTTARRRYATAQDTLLHVLRLRDEIERSGVANG